jgi:hypothetical protein
MTWDLGVVNDIDLGHIPFSKKFMEGSLLHAIFGGLITTYDLLNPSKVPTQYPSIPTNRLVRSIKIEQQRAYVTTVDGFLVYDYIRRKILHTINPGIMVSQIFRYEDRFYLLGKNKLDWQIKVYQAETWVYITTLLSNIRNLFSAQLFGNTLSMIIDVGLSSLFIRVYNLDTNEFIEKPCGRDITNMIIG